MDVRQTILYSRGRRRKENAPAQEGGGCEAVENDRWCRSGRPRVCEVRPRGDKLETVASRRFRVDVIERARRNKVKHGASGAKSVINKDTNYCGLRDHATHAWLPAIEAASSAL